MPTDHAPDAQDHPADERYTLSLEIREATVDEIRRLLITLAEELHPDSRLLQSSGHDIAHGSVH